MTDELVLTIAHCGKPMTFTRGTTTWEGQQGSGFEISTADYLCDCGATASVSVREPS